MQEVQDLASAGKRVCAFCAEVAQGNYSIHRDGFGIGPEVPLCDTCGGNEVPTCEEIWDRIATPAATPAPALLDVLVGIGSAHAGESLTPTQLRDRLMRDPEFRRRFNGPAPAEVTFKSEETAALAARFEKAARAGRS